mmetsp:Transcript_152023/g.264948  ORF Transcript_152023/g.264948 Transcript_152023/m.264948 type:complete len:208 (-) Transcript_152023:112-735(-)
MFLDQLTETGRSANGTTSARSPATFQRSRSAGDIVDMHSSPKRRPFDHHHPSKDGLGGSRGMFSAMELDVADEEEASRRRALPSRAFSHSTSLRPEIHQENVHANFAKVGDGLKIMHRIAPQKFRPISLHGEVFQGFWNTDWHRVDHIKNLRGRYPALRPGLQSTLGPYPQGKSQQEINRNRNFARSHGSNRIPRGMISVGKLSMIP